MNAEKVINEVIKKNIRVCPKPYRWVELFDLFIKLKPHPSNLAGEHPAPAPLILGIWNIAEDGDKQSVLCEQIEWAESNEILLETYQFLKSIEEQDWHHFGE